MTIKGITQDLAVGHLASGLLPADTEAPNFTDLINATVSPTGHIEKREGYSATDGYTVGAGTAAVVGLGLTDEGGGVVAITSDNKIYRINTPATDISATLLATGSGEARPNVVEYMEKLVLTKGGNVVLVADTGDASLMVNKPAQPTNAMTVSKSYGNPSYNNAGTTLAGQLRNVGPGTGTMYWGSGFIGTTGVSNLPINYLKVTFESLPIAGEFKAVIYKWVFGTQVRSLEIFAESTPQALTQAGAVMFEFPQVYNLATTTAYLFTVQPADYMAYNATTTNYPKIARAYGVSAATLAINGGFDAMDAGGEAGAGPSGRWPGAVSVNAAGTGAFGPTADSYEYDITFTGVLTGNRTYYLKAGSDIITYPNAWVVRNNTTGAFSLTLQLWDSVGVGTTVVIPQGETWQIAAALPVDSGLTGVKIASSVTTQTGWLDCEFGVAYDITFRDGLTGNYEYTYSAYDSANDMEGELKTATLQNNGMLPEQGTVLVTPSMTTDSIRVYRRVIGTTAWFLLGTFPALTTATGVPSVVTATGGVLPNADYAYAVFPAANGGTGRFGICKTGLATLAGADTKFTVSWTAATGADYYNVMLMYTVAGAVTTYYYRLFQTTGLSIVFDGITNGPTVGGTVTAAPSYANNAGPFFVDNVPSPTVTFLSQVDPVGAKWVGIADDMAIFSGYTTHTLLAPSIVTRSFWRTEPGTSRILSSYTATLPDEILGMQVVGRDIYFFMRREIHVYQNINASAEMPFGRTQVIRRGLWFNSVSNRGASDSIVQAMGKMFWLADDGDFYVMDGYQIARISWPHMTRRIQKLLITQTDMTKIHGHDCKTEGKIRWVFETVGVTLVYDYRNEKWSEDYGGTASPPTTLFPMGSYMEANGVAYMGDLNATGKVYRFGRNSSGASYSGDGATAINFYRRFSYTFKTQSGQSNQCSLGRLRIRAMMLDPVTRETTTNFTATLKWRFDKEPTFQTATLTWPNQDSGHALPFAELYQLGTGREVEFILEETANSSYPLVITNFLLTYTELGR